MYNGTQTTLSQNSGNILICYSGGWNTELFWNLNDRGPFNFSIVFCFPMVDKMAAILFGFSMVGIIGKPNFWIAWTILKRCRYKQLIRNLWCFKAKWPPFCSKQNNIGKLNRIGKPNRRLQLE